jgi:hypothetical protein
VPEALIKSLQAEVKTREYQLAALRDCLEALTNGMPNGADEQVEPEEPKPAKRQYRRRSQEPSSNGEASANKEKVFKLAKDRIAAAKFLAERGPQNIGEVAVAIGRDSGRGMAPLLNHEWFERDERGLYAVTPAGRQGIQ